jgi:DNA uptake protein ComE-like DNA-binding protein
MKMLSRILLAAALVTAASPAFAQGAATSSAVKPTAPVATPAPVHPVAAPVVTRVNINAATSEQLMAVKGMTHPGVEAILKGRPFKAVDELSTRKLLPADVFATVKDALTVK